MSEAGALMFARYAFPPNELGYCGPSGARAMLVPGALADIERRARHFEGAWVYLEALAEALDYDDPLAEEVVGAYWLGSDDLDRVDPASLLALLRQRFPGQRGGTWKDSAQRARAHHSFQVFEVYPWAAMLQAGLPAGPAVEVLDQCRIRSGRVVAVDGEWASVSADHLGWDGVHLESGPESVEQVRWSVDGQSMMVAPGVGDLVALHWGWVCDTLTADQSARVARLERQQRTILGLS